MEQEGLRQQSLAIDRDTKNYYFTEQLPDGTEQHTDLGTPILRIAIKRRDALCVEPAADPAYAAPQQDPQPAHLVGGTVEWAMAEHLNRSAPDLAEATRGAYQCQAGHVVRLLGVLPLMALRRAHIDEYAATRTAEGVGGETQRKELMLLRAAVRRARDLGAQTGEVEGQLFPKLRSTYVPGDRWLTVEEYQRLMAELPEPRKLQLQVACYTGARRAELMRMRWEDINWDRCELTVHQSKPARSRRMIPLHAELLTVLRAMRKARGKILPSFNNLYREWERAAVKAGVERLSLNDCRRTFASWMVQGGVPLYDVSKLLGHGSIAMVQKVYGHLSSKELSKAVAALPSTAGTTNHD